MWDNRGDEGRWVAEGVYCYRLQTGDFNRIKGALLFSYPDGLASIDSVLADDDSRIIVRNDDADRGGDHL